MVEGYVQLSHGHWATAHGYPPQNGEGCQGQSFRLARPGGEVTGGLKTPGYSKTVLRTGLHCDVEAYARAARVESIDHPTDGTALRKRFYAGVWGKFAGYGGKHSGSSCTAFFFAMRGAERSCKERKQTSGNDSPIFRRCREATIASAMASLKIRHERSARRADPS